jgi:hypothetical protein
MTDRPIIFSAAMIQALLAGRKTQTRRIINPQPPSDARYAGIHFASDEPDTWFFNTSVGPHKIPIRFDVGDRLYVRESHALVPSSAYRMSEGVVQTINPADRYEAAIYAAGWDRSKPKWRPSIHMPRWGSRLTLLVTDVRVQRLQDIGEEDAEAEGARSAFGEWFDAGFCQVPADGVPRRTLFAGLWGQIHGADAWAENPWVVAISFTVQRGNIDAMPASP